MKRIHIRKPDIKGFFTKVRNLKKEDIKRHFKEKKERRQRILEERRNSKFAKKMQPVYNPAAPFPSRMCDQLPDRDDIPSVSL